MITAILWGTGGLVASIAYLALIIFCIGSWTERWGTKVKRAISTSLLFVITASGISGIVYACKHHGPDSNCMEQQKVATVTHTKYGPEYGTAWKCTLEGNSPDQVVVTQ